MRQDCQLPLGTGHLRFPGTLPGAIEFLRNGRLLGPMDLVSVCQNKFLSGGQTPHEYDLVFFSPAVRSGQAPFDGFAVGKTEFPTDPAFRPGEHLSLFGGLAIDLIGDNSVVPSRSGCHVASVCCAKRCRAALSLRFHGLQVGWLVKLN